MKKQVFAAAVIFLFGISSFCSPLIRAQSGRFDFNDGTIQNWTIDQIYETDTHIKITPALGFVLQNDQNRLAATANPLLIGGSSGTKSHYIYVTSPDLGSLSDWQNISGYSIDILRTLAGQCGEPGNIKFYAQLQLRVIDQTDQSTHLFAEHDGTDFVFHEIEYNTPYHFVWNPSWLSDPKYKVKQIRIRLLGEHDYGTGECAAKGSWFIDNVRAESNTTPTESLTLTSPNGAETWEVGSTHTISWNSQNLTHPVKIEYSTDWGTHYTSIVSSTANNGSYTWTIPATPSVWCLIRISDATDASPQDESDNCFTIRDPAQWLTVVAPNGGEIWQVGTQYEIKWSSSGVSSPVAIDFSSRENHFRYSIASSTPNDGSFNWTIPEGFTLPVNGKIRIRVAAAGIPADASDADFTLVAAGANNTLTGTNVPVDLGGGSKITFDHVTAQGNTNMTTSNSGSPPPNGFTLTPAANPLYYVITTTASFTGKIKICLHYDDTGLTPVQEAVLKLKVVQNGQWVDLTTSLDVGANLICGEVNHLSEFAVMFATTGEPAHFDFTANTGNSYSIVINDATLDGNPLAAGDEVGVFTSSGLCVGASVWDGTTPLALSAWGDDSQTTDVDGFVTGDKMAFRIWSQANRSEFAAHPTYTQGDGAFGTGSYAQISYLEAVSSVTQNLILPQGWSWISFNVRPPDLNVENVLDSLDHLSIAVNNAGEFYIPAVINGIGQWNILEGYKIYLDSGQPFSVTGQTVPSDTAIVLAQGWNFVSYLPNQAQDAERALQTVLANLAIIKNDEGHFFIPQVIQNLCSLTPGKGYKLYLNAPDTLIYPSATRVAKHHPQSFFAPASQPRHFVPRTKTGDFYSLVVRVKGVNHATLRAGDEIGVFTESGVCAGAAAWNGKGCVGIAAWADDPKTVEKDGFRMGEKIIFKQWDAKEATEIVLRSQFKKGDGRFGTDAYASVELTPETAPTTWALRQNYPNPFNSQTLIVFTLPRNERVELKIFDLKGAEIRTLIAHLSMKKGKNQCLWDGLDNSGYAVPSGIYLYRLKTGSFTSIKKATFIK